MITGSCHCKKVQFRIDAPLQGIIHCHCHTCQKLSGTSYGSTAFTNKDALCLTAGEEFVKGYTSSPGKDRYFCSHCGSPLYSLVHEKGLLGVRVGVLDQDPGIQSKTHIWLDDEKPWFEVSTSLPMHKQFPKP